MQGTLSEIREAAYSAGINVLHAVSGDAVSVDNLNISCVHPVRTIIMNQQMIIQQFILYLCGIFPC